MCLESIIHVYCCKCLNIWQIIGLQGRKGLGPFLFALWVKILKLSEVSKETEVKHFFFTLADLWVLWVGFWREQVQSESELSSELHGSSQHLSFMPFLELAMCCFFFFFSFLKGQKEMLQLEIYFLRVH